MRCMVWALMLVLSQAVWAAPRLDVLIVIDGSDPGQVKLEDRVRHSMEKTRADLGLASTDLRVDTDNVQVSKQQAEIKHLQLDGLPPLLAVCQLDGSTLRPVKVLQKTEIAKGDMSIAVTETMGFAMHALGKALPYLGLSGKTNSPEVEARLHVPAVAGVVVLRVGQGGPAEAAGVRPRDVITEIGGVAVTTPLEISSVVHAAKIGQPLTIKLQRGNQTLTVSPVVRQAPQQ